MTHNTADHIFSCDPLVILDASYAYLFSSTEEIRKEVLEAAPVASIIANIISEYVKDWWILSVSDDRTLKVWGNTKNPTHGRAPTKQL